MCKELCNHTCFNTIILDMDIAKEVYTVVLHRSLKLLASSWACSWSATNLPVVL